MPSFNIRAGALASALMLLSLGSLAEQQTTLGALRIAKAWSNALPPVAKTGAVYVTIANTGTKDERLVAIESSIAARAELHNHSMDDGVMKMRKVEGGVAIAAGDEVVFEPGGLHIMLMGLEEPITSGVVFQVTLTFERAGNVEVPVSVREMDGTMTHSSGSHSHGTKQE